MSLITRVSSLSVLIQVRILLVYKRAVRQNTIPRVTYSPMLAKVRILNQNYIYSWNDVEVIIMPEMRIISFLHLSKDCMEGRLMQDRTDHLCGRARYTHMIAIEQHPSFTSIL
jgi:hypothetical protein